MKYCTNPRFPFSQQQLSAYGIRKEVSLYTFIGEYFRQRVHYGENMEK